MPIKDPSADMGEIANLITNMTIAGASTEEIERAVKHSRVVMDYEKSARENGISELMEKYQDAKKNKPTTKNHNLGDFIREEIPMKTVLDALEGDRY